MKRQREIVDGIKVRHGVQIAKRRRSALEKWPPQPRPAELAGEPSEDMKVANRVRGIADSLTKRR